MGGRLRRLVGERPGRGPLPRGEIAPVVAGHRTISTALGTLRGCVGRLGESLHYGGHILDVVASSMAQVMRWLTSLSVASSGCFPSLQRYT